ncbi:doublecortin domain-containing protein 1 isoform X3 [Crotalus tigris]|uniref:doublecortin domain-containing protein 1 isoform X3 n=1 Tax=Crotalus tigris TaxID=88082 RepID=UPI00192F98AE|nr:doublecortin domain-containing protein 1 isoform X3 [Crotalus tigris]
MLLQPIEMESNETENDDLFYIPRSETSERNYFVSSSSWSSQPINVEATGIEKKLIMPFTKKAKKTEEKQRKSLLGPKSAPQSLVISRRSGFQDGSIHQTKPVHKNDRKSKLASYESNSTNNFCLTLPYKRNRPISAPSGQLRCQQFSSSKLYCTRKASEISQIFKQKPQILRVTAYKNGAINIFAKVTVPLSIKLLLEECTEKLKLNMAARRIFLADGTEVLSAIDIPHDADVYISTGEPFSNPFKKIKDHLLLMKNATWTLNGLIFPRDVKRRKADPVLSKRMKKLIEKPMIRLLVFKNCMGQDGYEIAASPNQIEKFLDICTMRLNLILPAKYIYNMHGEKMEDLLNVPMLDKCLQNSITPLWGPLWVSKGEGFSPTGAKIYIQGVLLALYQRLKSAKIYCEQLDFATDGQKEKITDKSVLSMKKQEMISEQHKVHNLIDELQAVIRSYKGHLSKLAPQLQAEQEQCASYVYQHIKELPTSTFPSQGLQLKVYNNGKDTGETLVYISRKEMESNYGDQPDVILEKVRHTIHQRLQLSADFKPSGLSHFPTHLFDETGQEIKNPLLLQNEQKIWVSYGEDYRSPLNPVLSLTFDKVIATKKNGITVIYKTLLDPSVDLLPRYDSWEACDGFPENFQFIKAPEHQILETVEPDNLFFQNKTDPQMVLLMSVTIENMRKGTARRNYCQNAIDTEHWPLSNVWLITKAGKIVSRAMAQGSLSVGHPVRAMMQDGIPLEGYKLTLQKRDKNNICQYWEFGNDGSIHSKAYPEFVLTYLEELNVKEALQIKCSTHEIHSVFHQRTDDNSEDIPVPHQNLREVLENNDRNSKEKQLSRPLDAHLMPKVSSGENCQLTVALVRKLEEKHPKASAQRWAIKHEGTSKPGQWKQSKVENPLWNKLTYMWPVLPNGELNQAFDWPIEGLLIPNSPPLKKPAGRKSEINMPLRLKVLRNGEPDKNKALSVLGLDSAFVIRKQNADTEKKQKPRGHQKMYTDTNSEKELHNTEFQQFLERCTTALNLPFAARRLFTEKGVELFVLKDLEKDQLLYISCGEQWIDPQWTTAQHKKRLQCNNLASDIMAMRAYCVMRNLKNFVLQAKNDIVVGAKLSVARALVEFEEKKGAEEPEKEKCEKSIEKIKDDTDKYLNSHIRSHLKTEAYHRSTKYAWQQISYDFDEDYNIQKEKTEQFFEDAELYKKYRHQPKLAEEIQKDHHQHFEFKNGKIINCSFPNLVLGVENTDLHSGTEVVLLEKKCDDVMQHWVWKEESRSFHLAIDPDLVLAVSMPTVLNGCPKFPLEIQECPIILQKYKPHNYGAANQKWNFTETKVFSAFYSTILDLEITAANYASICTFTITKTEKIDQPGYYFLSPYGKKKIMICLACGRTLRGKKELKKLLPGTIFSCASGFQDRNNLPFCPFKCLDVNKIELFSDKAESTLHYFEEVLASLKNETSLQVISEKISAALDQKTVKIIAYKNGDGYRNGQLIVAHTFPRLLSLCTRRLELSRTACKLYNSEGTLILTVQDLVLCAANDYLKKQETEERNEEAISDTGLKQIASVFSRKDKNKNIKFTSSEITSDIDHLVLSSILKNPVEVWVSSGEPFLPLDTLQNTERQIKQKWLEKDKILADLNAMKHKMRQLQGRRITKYKAADLVPTKSPFQPVVVEGGWTEETQEEMKLMETIQHTEMHLSELEALQFQRSSPFSPKLLAKNDKCLYKQPTTKRVWAYLNGNIPDKGAHVWGKSMIELLDSCTTHLKMSQPAKILYTPDGHQLQSWEEIERDMIVCVSAGHAFMSQKAVKHEIEIRAHYARIRKQQGPESTNIVVSPSTRVIDKFNMNSTLLALTGTPHEDVYD